MTRDWCKFKENRTLFFVCFIEFLLFPAVISFLSLSLLSDKANTPRLAHREIVTLTDLIKATRTGG